MKKYVFLAFPIILLSCSNGESSHFEGGLSKTEEQTADLMMLPAPPEGNVSTVNFKEMEVISDNTELAVIQKQIIKTAQIRIQVEKVKESKAIVSQLVQKAGGYLATSNESRDNASYTATFVIRVPAAKFEGLLEELLKQGIFVEQNNVTAQDVTEEFIDIQTRLKTKRALETRYLELLKQAKTMKDILELEKALQTVREEIESKEGRLKYLTNQVGYSTINLDIYEQVPYAAAPEIGFWSKLFAGAGNGWSILLQLIIGTVTLWPLWIILALGVWISRRLYIKRKLRKEAL
ncbi:DUF4349 domain-containing protein [Cytophagaceae bacterium DM2B3-1]|uniref:DUF4349 domain-containing protein n=1 Tax=Xanthocytophaga flava TaxID=3048013 RepID=A0ABT7CL96_9BACT|nr:DUF4349 domain-containing protein [Xanthocytophaga flavus]MDJ1493777.1 DUF4349 domain-containing protein [Xanthocytophaga flavus]